ncbi:MAG TPA: hypothetical protein VLA45_12075 [Paracoccaceae bacterium]|nr:hypothetical protein [Paracoccaceae bacterium]
MGKILMSRRKLQAAGAGVPLAMGPGRALSPESMIDAARGISGKT